MWQWLKSSKLAKLFLIFDLILTLSLVGIYFYNFKKSATLTILVAPENSSVTINGKEYKNGTYRFFPGTIEAKITSNGFEPKSTSLTLEKNSDTRLYTFLEKNDNFNYYHDHYSDFTILKQVITDNDTAAKNFITSYDNEIALKNALPIFYNNSSTNPNTHIELSISYETKKCKKEKFCILISDLFNGNYDFALSLLRDRGYNPNDYEIIYTYTCEKGDTKKCPRF